MAFARMRSVPSECSMNAVIYARYSSDKQTENSIDFQLRADQAYCEAKGLKIVGEYIDRAISGTTDNRPEFQRMIKDAKKQQFAYIVVYRFDRFARNRYDSAIYKKELESHGVRVLSTEESIGTGDESIILESIYEAMAESYSRRLSRVVTQGMRETALKGLSTGGNLAYGLMVVDHRIVPNEKQSPVVRYCFEARDKLAPKKKIADALNEQGYRTKTGKLFTINTVTQILSNSAHKGEYIFDGIKIEIPASVSPELWDRVQEIETREKKSYGKKASKAYYSLSGKLFCGECGAPMIGDSGTSRSKETHFYYTCATRKKNRSCKKKSEKKDFIEWYICEQTVHFVLTTENIKKIAKNVVALSEKDLGSDRLSQLEKQVSAIEQEIDTAADALIKTNSPALIKRINEKVALLESQQNSLEEEISRLRVNRELCVTVSEVETFLNSFRNGDLHDEDFRRRLIKALVNCVYLFDDKVVIYFNIRGMKKICFIDMLSDVDDLAKKEPPEQNCSDSSSFGGPSRTRTLDRPVMSR